eukprot:2306001-Alexandrium_andersonii.AAC.1
MRGFTSHRAELEARLQLLERTPTLVAVNESFLDVASGTPQLTGFTVVARRDRGSPAGGVL